VREISSERGEGIERDKYKREKKRDIEREQKRVREEKNKRDC
jgi:hypothetical protein